MASCLSLFLLRSVNTQTSIVMVESGFWARVGRLGTALGFFLRFTSERQLSRATGSCDLALRKNPTS